MFFDSAMVRLRISPASVVGDHFADGGDDRVAELGMRSEAIEDGLMDGGPEFVFGGGVVGVRRDEEDLVLGRVGSRLVGDFRGGQEVPVEVRLVVRVPIGVEELVVVDVVVVLHAARSPTLRVAGAIKGPGRTEKLSCGNNGGSCLERSSECPMARAHRTSRPSGTVTCYQPVANYRLVKALAGWRAYENRAWALSGPEVKLLD